MSASRQNRQSFLAQARDIFAQAVEIDSDEERNRFLGDACRDNQELLAEVTALLAAHGGISAFLDWTHSPMEFSLSSVCGLETGDQIGPYVVLEKLGEGGFGEVFLAEQTEPVVRHVALKILKPGLDTRGVRRAKSHSAARLCSDRF